MPTAGRASSRSRRERAVSISIGDGSRSRSIESPNHLRRRSHQPAPRPRRRDLRDIFTMGARPIGSSTRSVGDPSTHVSVSRHGVLRGVVLRNCVGVDGRRRARVRWSYRPPGQREASGCDERRLTCIGARSGQSCRPIRLATAATDRLCLVLASARSRRHPSKRPFQVGYRRGELPSMRRRADRRVGLGSGSRRRGITCAPWRRRRAGPASGSTSTPAPVASRVWRRSSPAGIAERMCAAVRPDRGRRRECASGGVAVAVIGRVTTMRHHGL